MKYIFAVFFFLLISFPALAENIIYSSLSDTEPWTPHVKKLIIAALKAQEPEKDYNLLPTGYNMVQKRSLHSLRSNTDIDIFWTMTDKEREEGLYVLRIPLLKGILGKRILIIRKNDVGRFRKINSLEDAQQITYGQGHDWPDADILENAGMPVSRSSAYMELIYMLSRKRFDAFPSGICEVKAELELRPEIGGVTIDDHIAFSYNAPVFIFMNVENKELQQKLETGFEKIIADGTFDRIFYSNFKECIDDAKMDERVIFKLDNPGLSKKTIKAMKDYKDLLTLE